MSKRQPQEWIVTAVVLALIALNLADHAFNTWFDRHSFVTDAVSTLLGLAVAALVVNRSSARRRLRDRAQVMAAPGAMIAAQALRSTQAITAALDRSGDRPDDIEQRLNDAAAQVRATVQPLLQRLDVDQQSDLWAPAHRPPDGAD